MTRSLYEQAQEAARFLEQRTPLRPRLGLVLGSGLGAFADSLTQATRIPYQEIPHFPTSTAAGHAGRLVVGRCRGVPVAVMQGRAHYYEGYPMSQVTFPIRVLGLLGVRTLVLTNAAGGINRKLRARGLLLIRDHVNLQATNPLLGPNDERFGPRFPDMTEAYSKELIAIAKKVARRQRLRLFEGVYAAVHGPSYETPAEVRALARLGADVVGMSTVPEVIVANHMSLRVLGISCVTNMAAGLSKKKISHDEVLEAGEHVGRQFSAFLQALIPAIAEVEK
ncbi:MAG: purine-nucleoside phosphorylase [Acidobacteria bacterium]|nr:purine-nucleoside phosphorylase [Acidobacteriota bacterium]